MKFSIIIPVYNVAPYLRACLDSLAAQSLTDWEAICVDDGSTDGSGAILDEVAARDKRVKVIHKSNSGVGAARNVALDWVTGEWVCFVDADDVLGRDWLAAIAMAGHGEEVDWVRTGYVRWYAEKLPSLPAVRQPFDRAQVTFACSGDEKWKVLDQGTMIWLNAYRSRAIADWRFNDNMKVCEDTVFCMGMLGRVRQVAVTNYDGYFYRMRPTSACHTRCPSENAIEYLSEIEKFVANERNPQSVKYLTRTLTTNFNACFGWCLDGANKCAIECVRQKVWTLWRRGAVSLACVKGANDKARWIAFFLTGNFRFLFHCKRMLMGKKTN